MFGFINEPRAIELFVKEEKGDRILGWATVVKHRDGWVVTTEIEPMIFCCGSVEPAFHHLRLFHEVDPAETDIRPIGE